MSYFQTIEFSDARYEKDGLHHITVYSKNLQRRGSIIVFTPQGINISPDRLPLVTLLHGVYGDAWSWAFKAGAHILAQQLIDEKIIKPMILAMPSDGLWGDGSGYTQHSGFNFEKWIVDDVKQAIGELLDLESYQATRFIAGLSMGGYGALRLGIKYGEQFKGISAMSSMTSWQDFGKFSELNYRDIQPSHQEDAIIDLASLYRDTIPALRFDCGIDDLLIEGNRHLHKSLESAEINHLYEEYPGGHEWSYWREHLGDTLRFFNSLI